MHRNLIALVFAILFAAPAFAQERVTVVRTNGERVSGRFEDWDHSRNIVFVRVSLDNQRRIPFNDIARIEVEGGGQAAVGTSGSNGGGDVLVTRSGEQLSGQLTDIQGGQGSANESQPRTVTFRTSGGERRFRMSDVAMLQLRDTGNPGAGSDGAANLPQVDAPAGSFHVAANTKWTPTNIHVRRGESVQFDARGQIELSTNAQDIASTAGATSGRKPGYGAPAPQFPAGALLGRIGENGQPFAIGNQTQPLPMNADGMLYLGVNDDEVGDNRGEFVVSARLAGRRR